jgi:hypothetical protein
MLAGAVRELNDRLRFFRNAPDKSGERRSVFTQISKRSMYRQSISLIRRGVGHSTRIRRYQIWPR